MAVAKLDYSRITAGRFSLQLERTLRVPADGKVYPLPPGFSTFPVYRVPAGLSVKADFLAPMHQFEAVWLRFEAADWKPNAVQIASHGINVLTGEKSPSRLRSRNQNYVVCPLQPWLDGFKTESGAVRQFVAAPLGSGITVSEQLGGSAEEPALHVRVFEPRPGIFPDRPPPQFHTYAMPQESIAGVGLGAGGTIKQQVYKDDHPLSTWNQRDFTDIRILLVNSAEFRALTGEEPPPSPISAADYTRAGFPWFELYEEGLPGIEPTGLMRAVKPLVLDDPSVTPTHVRKIRRTRGKSRR